jgi:hypothetical protein
MTERSLPIVDGAPACPFVAFDDDRDERAASPDHRHRCYAEPQPAPRALAHQEAYCLSSAFPVCPTFQDWARREAARSRDATPQGLPSIAAVDDTGRAPRSASPNRSAPPQRTSGRRGRDEPSDDAWIEEGDEDLDDAAYQEEPPPRRGRGLSGSYADRAASPPASPPGVPGMGTEPEYEVGVDDDAATPAAAAGGIAADAPGMRRDSDRRARERPSSQRPSSEQRGAWDEEDDEDGEPPVEQAVRRRRRREVEPVAAPGLAAAAAQDRRPPRRREANAPEWERARPAEAYPTLRSRRLSELSIPPILVGVIALAIAAAVLFSLPGLLGFGSPSTGGTTAPTTPIRTPIVTAAPTPVPQPTQQVYVVQPGDTMSRIAGRFGVPLAELIAANAESVPNPDQLEIGAEVIIPGGATPSEAPAAT